LLHYIPGSKSLEATVNFFDKGSLSHVFSSVAFGGVRHSSKRHGIQNNEEKLHLRKLDKVEGAASCGICSFEKEMKVLL